MYSIADYDERYRPYNKSGEELQRADWVKMPCKPRGEGLNVLLEYKRGLEVFGIWCLLLQKATLEKAENRGKLLNHKGVPATIPEIAKSISQKNKVKFVEYALSVLCTIGWVNNDSPAEESSAELPPIPTKSRVIKSSVIKSRVEKSKYKDFVFLSEDEYKKLVERFGERQTMEKIAALNDYIGSMGKRYKSHYHTILNWARRDKESAPPEAPKICIVDRKEGYKWQLNNKGGKVYLCKECLAAFGSGNFGKLPPAQVERIVLEGKAKR